jgi:hypothetical protein
VKSAILLRDDRDVHLRGQLRTHRDTEWTTGQPSGTPNPSERPHLGGPEPPDGRLRGTLPAQGRPRGRLASLVGAALGAWLGLLTGLVPGLLLPDVSLLPALLGGLLMGAGAGAALGLVVHWATGRRDPAAGALLGRAATGPGSADARLHGGPRELVLTEAEARTVAHLLGMPVFVDQLTDLAAGPLICKCCGSPSQPARRTAGAGMPMPERVHAPAHRSWH